MKIIVTFVNQDKKADYIVEDNITIEKAFDIIGLNDNSYAPKGMLYVYSSRLQEAVSTSLTFKQAKIYTGDMVSIADEGDKI